MIFLNCLLCDSVELYPTPLFNADSRTIRDLGQTHKRQCDGIEKVLYRTVLKYDKALCWEGVTKWAYSLSPNFLSSRTALV